MESKRMTLVQQPIIQVINELIKKNQGTISLGQGMVCYGPPKDALHSTLNEIDKLNISNYSAVHGINELREGVVRKLLIENNIDACKSSSYLAVTAGANMGFFNVLLAIADIGDEVIILSPYYFNYEMAIRIVGAIPVVVQTDNNWQPDINEIKKHISPKTKAIVTISPNNPTGAVYSKSILTEINLLCKEHNIYHISDEAYEYFVYNDAKHFSPASIPDSENYTISLYSMSKCYGMAGWRIGFVLIPEVISSAYCKIQDTDLICPTLISQHLAVKALEVGASYTVEHLKKLGDRRKLFCQAFDKLRDKVDYVLPNGSIYFLLKIDSTLSSFDFVKNMIEKYRISAIPGVAFGVTSGCYIRVSYSALPDEMLEDAVKRLSAAIAECR